MANEVLVKVGTQQRFFVTGSFSPADAGTNWTIGSPTDNVLTLSALANAAGRQSDKADLGATRAAAFEVLGCVDFTGETPVAGEHVDYHWATSVSTTQGTGNVAGNSGADAAAPGGPTPAGLTLAEFLDMCNHFIGSIVVSDDAAVLNGYVGVLVPTNRYGQLVVVNEADDAFEADDVEMHQVLNPIVDEVQ